MTKKLPPVHPGEILKETLSDLGISMNQLALAIRNLRLDAANEEHRFVRLAGLVSDVHREIELLSQILIRHVLEHVRLALDREALRRGLAVGGHSH